VHGIRGLHCVVFLCMLMGIVNRLIIEEQKYWCMSRDLDGSHQNRHSSSRIHVIEQESQIKRESFRFRGVKKKKVSVSCKFKSVPIQSCQECAVISQ
jgi:hypothetical protein